MSTKIIGLTNTEDVMWYQLSPEDETLKQIDSIFDIADTIFQEDTENIHSYAIHTKSKEMCFHKETDKFIVYFIFTKNAAHIILRKTLKWEEYNDEIQKNFKFDK